MSAHRRILPRLRGGAALLIGLLALLLPAQSALADGSADLNAGPDSASRHKLSPGVGSNAPNIDGYTVVRAYARAGETIQTGSSAIGLGGSADILVYAPGTSFGSTSEPGRRAPLLGDPVFATDVFSCAADDPGSGRIESRAEELAGPAPNLGGYPPCEYTAPADGVYAIVMVPYVLTGTYGATSVGAPNTTTTQGPTIAIWDVTVRDGAGTVQPGRVFTNLLEFAIPALAGTASNLSAFVATPAGYVFHVTVFNPRNKGWDLAANRTGVVDAISGEPIHASFQWGPTSGYPPTLEPTYPEAVAPQMWEGDAAVDSRYPIFFTTPDPAVFSGPGGLGETRGYAAAPMPPAGGLSPALSFTGSGGELGATVQGSGGTVTIAAPELRGERYELAIDLDHDADFGGGADVGYTGTLSETGAVVAWDGRDSSGAVVPCGASYEYRVTSTLPAMHIVQSDTGSEAGIEIERLSLPTDPLLGDPLAASYNDIDPYKETAITNAAPSAVSDGVSGPSFHGWSAVSGHADFTDTWASGHPVDGSGGFEVRCATASEPPAAKPPASNPSSNSGHSNPTAQPGAPSKPTKHKHKKRQPHLQPPRLSLTLTAATNRARPSSVIGYRITVTNSGGSAARKVEVCDSLAPGQRLLRTMPSANRKAKPCWTIAVLPAGARRVFRLTAMVDPGSRSGVQRSAATASAANVRGVRAERVAVRIRPLPETGCGSRLARPVTSLPVRPRC